MRGITKYFADKSVSHKQASKHVKGNRDGLFNIYHLSKIIQPLGELESIFYTSENSRQKSNELSPFAICGGSLN